MSFAQSQFVMHYSVSCPLHMHTLALEFDFSWITGHVTEVHMTDEHFLTGTSSKANPSIPL